MPRRKNPDYETREMLLERCNRQKRAIRILQTQLALADRALRRIGEHAATASKEVARLASHLTDTDTEGE